MSELPLADLDRRMRRRPGRPRKLLHPLVNGHVPGTPASAGRGDAWNDGGLQQAPPRALDTRTTVPRLLGLRDAAVYLGISTWTVRDWIVEGLLRPVQIPLPVGGRRRRGRFRKLLFDRQDLDRLIEAWKEPRS